jgi:hypothetical protein
MYEYIENNNRIKSVAVSQQPQETENENRYYNNASPESLYVVLMFQYDFTYLILILDTENITDFIILVSLCSL